MKVALIDPSLFTWDYDEALAQGLKDNGHNVFIYGRRWEIKSDSSEFIRLHFYRFLEKPLIKNLPPKMFLMLKGVSHIESMIRLLYVLRREKPDVIHFQWLPLPMLDRRFLPKLKRIAPVVLTVHDPAPFNDNPKSALQQLNSIEIMKDFDRLIVHTENAKRRVASYGVGTAEIDQVPHGILGLKNVDSIMPLKDLMASKDVVVLLFGYIKPYKGLDILLEAFAGLPDHIRMKARVRVVGRPQMNMDGFVGQIKRLGITDRVSLELGFVPDSAIRPLFESSDIVVFPYKEIDASGVLGFALNAGKPIVASSIGLFAEILSDEHGALVPPSDIPALTNALGTLIDNPQSRSDCSIAVRSLIASVPTWTEIGRMTTAVYERAIHAARQ